MATETEELRLQVSVVGMDQAVAQVDKLKESLRSINTGRGGAGGSGNAVEGIGKQVAELSKQFKELTESIGKGPEAMLGWVTGFGNMGVAVGSFGLAMFGAVKALQEFASEQERLAQASRQTGWDEASLRLTAEAASQFGLSLGQVTAAAGDTSKSMADLMAMHSQIRDRFRGGPDTMRWMAFFDKERAVAARGDMAQYQNDFLAMAEDQIKSYDAIGQHAVGVAKAQESLRAAGMGALTPFLGTGFRFPQATPADIAHQKELSAASERWLKLLGEIGDAWKKVGDAFLLTDLKEGNPTYKFFENIRDFTKEIADNVKIIWGDPKAKETKEARAAAGLPAVDDPNKPVPWKPWTWRAPAWQDVLRGMRQGNDSDSDVLRGMMNGPGAPAPPIIIPPGASANQGRSALDYLRKGTSYEGDGFGGGAPFGATPISYSDGFQSGRGGNLFEELVSNLRLLNMYLGQMLGYGTGGAGVGGGGGFQQASFTTGGPAGGGAYSGGRGPHGFLGEQPPSSQSSGRPRRPSILDAVRDKDGNGIVPKVGGDGDLDRAAFDKTFGGTPLANQYENIVAAAKENNVPPSTMAAIIAHETGHGTSAMLRNQNNPAGLMDPATGMSKGQSFGTIEEGISAAGKSIGKRYAEAHGDLAAMQKVWAPEGAANDPRGLNKDWLSGVRSYASKLSSDGGPAGGVPHPYERRKGEPGEFNYAATGALGQPGQNLTEITLSNGKKVTVNAAVADRYQGFLNALIDRGYPIKDVGGYAMRNKVGGGGTSMHAYGAAVDINPGRNPYQGGTTDLPSDVEELAWKHGLSWGGRFGDPMHFEPMGPQAMAHKQQLLADARRSIDGTSRGIGSDAASLTANGTVNLNVHAPSGTRVTSDANGSLFKNVQINRNTQMMPASNGPQTPDPDVVGSNY
jgi:D-alanyl-D-alanine carboxypeptidase/Mannosyl-glycoprotein endo-beta-N-acetylglucosaminidase